MKDSHSKRARRFRAHIYNNCKVILNKWSSLLFVVLCDMDWKHQLRKRGLPPDTKSFDGRGMNGALADQITIVDIWMKMNPLTNGIVT